MNLNTGITLIDHILHEVNAHQQTIQQLVNDNLEHIDAMCMEVLGCLKNDGKIFFMGNGGSAADAQHLAAEFIGRFKRNRRALPALALTTDTSVVTAISNDFGYEYVFARQLSALCTDRDAVILISTSGNSTNLLEAAREASRKKACTIGLLGNNGGALAANVNIPVIVASAETARIQECHILIGHILCQICDEYFSINH